MDMWRMQQGRTLFLLDFRISPTREPAIKSSDFKRKLDFRPGAV